MERISRTSAVQRSGRAGREKAGVCCRLYTEVDWDAMHTTSDPEVLRADLLAVTLHMLAMRQAPERFDWLDAPPPQLVTHALHALASLGTPPSFPFPSAQE